MTVEAGMVKRLDGIDETLIEGFIDECRLRNLAPRTIIEYVSCLRTVSEFLKKKGLRLTEVDKKVLRKILVYLTQ